MMGLQLKTTVLWNAALRLSLQSSVGWQNEYQLFGCVIIQMVMGVWPVAAYRWTQRSRLKLSLRIGDFHFDDPREQSRIALP